MSRYGTAELESVVTPSDTPSRWSVSSIFTDVVAIGRGGTPLFVAGDIPGFLLLFFNNLLNLSITYNLFVHVAGYDASYVAQRVLPGAGLSILLGCLFYWRQARVLAKETNRDDVCGQPFGLGTPSMFAFVSFILVPAVTNMGPIQAYSLIIFCNFWAGVMEALSGLWGPWVHKYVPLPALLSALSGIALALIATGSLYQSLAVPAVGLIPFFLFLFFIASNEELCYKIRSFSFIIPPMAIVIGTGVALAWIVNALFPNYVSFAADSGVGFAFPHPTFRELRDGFVHGARFAPVFLPLALINGIGSLQCIASASKVGDVFNTRTSLAANGMCTVLSALFGAPFPTTIFIGHPTMKKLGARSGYLLLTGIAVMVVTSFGLINWLLTWIPLTAMLPIVVYVGFDITVFGFTTDDHEPAPKMPRRHLLAVAVGIVPALANLSVQAVTTAVSVCGKQLPEVFALFASQGFFFSGAVALTQGFLLTCMLWSGVVVSWIDRTYLRAAIYLSLLTMLSWVGLIHAYVIDDSGIANSFVGERGSLIAAPGFAFSYGLLAALSLGMHILDTLLLKRPLPFARRVTINEQIDVSI